MKTGSIYKNLVMGTVEEEDKSKCPHCKGQMVDAKLVNNKNIFYCKSCHISIPKEKIY